MMYNPIRTKPTSLAFRERTFRIVNAAVGTHGGEAAIVLNQRYAPPPERAEGESQPHTDYRQVFDNLGSELVRVREAMHAANKAHLGRLALIVDLQKQRDRLTSELFERFYKARHTLESLFGRQRGFEVLAVDGETPRDPVGLIQQVRSTVDFLNEPKVELPAVDLIGVDMDFTAMATQLGDDADELETVLDTIDQQRREAETTRLAKNQAIADFDQHYRWVGAGLETYFHLAGMHELAAKVRPSARRSGRLASDEDLDPDAVEPIEGEEPAELPAAEPADGD